MLSYFRIIPSCHRFTNVLCRNAWTGKETLNETDPELWDIIKKEKVRQKHGLELIASENFTSRSVHECLGSCLTNKYSEGYPGARYYGGNKYIDMVERMARSRMLDLFDLPADRWGVNVQPLSGTPANFAVYTALLRPNDRIMGLHLPDGGHLSHGFSAQRRSISATSLFFQSMPYRVDPVTGLIDYDEMERSARLLQPRLIVAGITAYSRLLDYARFRRLCDEIGAYLLADMSHVSGLVAAGVIPTPFDHADVVSTTTHKSLRGPRGAAIFARRGDWPAEEGGKARRYDYADKVDFAVFPQLHGGPHQNAIAGIATMAKQAKSDEFKEYGRQVLANAAALSDELSKLGHKVVTGGTDCHLVLVDLVRGPTVTRVDGARADAVCEAAEITLNKNTVPGDRSALVPGGLRLGSPALTTRGMREPEFREVARFVHRAAQLAAEVAQGKAKGKNLSDFKKMISEDPEIAGQIAKIAGDVRDFASKYPMPGWEDW